MASKGQDPTHARPEFRGSVRVDDANPLVPASEKEAEQTDARVVGNSETTPDMSSNAGAKRRKRNSTIAHNTATSFSILSISCQSSGWIIRPEQLCYDEPPQIDLCQWVVERLHAARNAELQDKPPLLRHYGSAQTKPKGSRARAKALPAPLVNGVPQIPDVRQNPPQQKLHYRINDGSSFIYYPSGCMAVCQSHSNLPCGGFYTNVFSDSQCPAFLATVTAFGHGAVTDPLSSAITALWDQDGGFICDQLGNVTKEWRWTPDHTPSGKIVIQVSDLISVRLFSGTSGLLSFRCDNDRVHLPLSGLSHVNPPKEMQRLQADAKFTCSDAAHKPLMARKTESPAVSPERKRNLTLTPGRRHSVGPSLVKCHTFCIKEQIDKEPDFHSWEASQMVTEMEGLEAARWKRGGHAVRELRRLQQRVRRTLDDWLAYYREAIGIRCPDIKRKPEAPLRTGLRGQGRSAALPSLNPPERTDAKPELHEPHSHPMVPAESASDTSTNLPRTSKKRGKEGPRVTHIGPLQIHGSIQLESVIIPVGLESQPRAVSRCPAPLPFTPSVPLTVCPVLLGAALLGEGGPKRCCCSSTQMPAVSDLEYDAFVMGQPPHSKQILVVCVTRLNRPVSTQAVPEQNPLEQLYRRMNKHRTMPCTQCQMDSFRLVKYELSAVEHGCGVQNVLLQQRHNAAPGMVLMYIRGKLLFVGNVFNDHKASVMELQKQISRARVVYRSGVSLPQVQ